MPELKLGYAFEGATDYRFLTVLVARLIQEFADTNLMQPVTLAQPSILRPSKKGFGFLGELHFYVERLAEDEVNIAVVVVDSGTGRDKKRQRQYDFAKAKAECLRVAPQICLADGIAVREMEAWLLADENVLKQVFNRHGRTKLIPRKPELILKPKELLNEIVRELTNGKQLTALPRLHLVAEELNLIILKQGCPAFDEFSLNLLRCLQNWQKQS